MSKSNLLAVPNVGKVLAGDLERIGIHDVAELRELGSKDVFLRLKQRDGDVCLHVLYALEGAVRGIRYPQLPPDVKNDLKEFFRQTK